MLDRTAAIRRFHARAVMRFTDLDGTRPNKKRYFAEHHPDLMMAKPGRVDWRLASYPKLSASRRALSICRSFSTPALATRGFRFPCMRLDGSSPASA